MAVVLIVRPYGLLGKPQAAVRSRRRDRRSDPLPRVWPLQLAGGRWSCRCCCCRCRPPSPYALVLGIDLLIAVLFATSLHFIMGPGGMHSFGHAAYFGLGAYGAALLVKCSRLPMAVALLLAPLRGRARRAAVRLVLRAPVRRLSRDADARLRADRLVDRLPVGDAHRRQQRPGRHLAGARRLDRQAGLLPADARAARSPACCCCARILFAPFGYALRAGRDSPLRAEAIGIDVKRVHWIGLRHRRHVRRRWPAALFAFAKGTISPDVARRLALDRRLVMVLLGGVQTLTRARSSAPRSSPGCRTRSCARPSSGAALLGGGDPAAGAGVPAAASSAR